MVAYKRRFTEAEDGIAAEIAWKYMDKRNPKTGKLYTFKEALPIGYATIQKRNNTARRMTSWFKKYKPWAARDCKCLS
jgi:hypothetical protein